MIICSIKKMLHFFAVLWCPSVIVKGEDTDSIGLPVRSILMWTTHLAISLERLWTVLWLAGKWSACIFCCCKDLHVGAIKGFSSSCVPPFSCCRVPLAKQIAHHSSAQDGVQRAVLKASDYWAAIHAATCREKGREMESVV